MNVDSLPLPIRHSIRMKDYDYGLEGFYFVTIVCKNRKCILGEIQDGKMILNEYGKIVQEQWENTSNVRPNVNTHGFVVMPNHFHAIVEIVSKRMPSADNSTNVSLDPMPPSPSQTLGSIIRGFKGAVSGKIGDSIWQRNYYDHIIRNQRDFDLVSEYILKNPQRWNDDMFRL